MPAVEALRSRACSQVSNSCKSASTRLARATSCSYSVACSKGFTHIEHTCGVGLDVVGTALASNSGTWFGMRSSQCGCGVGQYLLGQVRVVDCAGHGDRADKDTEGEDRLAFTDLAVGVVDEARQYG